MIEPDGTLRKLKKEHDFFIGIDSDGCAFDTMEVKHKDCFIPQIVRVFGLAAVAKYVREVAEFLNLYSHWRGINRFPGLTMTLEMLAERPEVKRRGFKVPELPGLRSWVDRETRLANGVLRAEVEATHDPDLALALEWSEAVNRAVGEIVREVPPFPFVRESLQEAAGRADVMVVSATPGEALRREWDEHGLTPYTACIAGQEDGSKKDLLALATAGRDDRKRVLMVGDAPGDRRAAEVNGILFYPIDPGDEDASWRRFYEEALPRFFEGTYAGAYMNEQVARFERLLPETPPWKRHADGAPL